MLYPQENIKLATQALVLWDLPETSVGAQGSTSHSGGDTNIETIAEVPKEPFENISIDHKPDDIIGLYSPKMQSQTSHILLLNVSWI